MSICEFSINMENKCGTCKYFQKYDETGIYGRCINSYTKIKNREYRSERSPSCISKENK